MNSAAFEAISAAWPTHYLGPVNPPPAAWRRVLSKANRVVGRPGDFFFFAEDRLRRIAVEVDAAGGQEARLDFFHGFTPWVRHRPARPYAAWSDCTFRDYMEIYHRRQDFRGADLARIERAEASWLKGARRVLFTSDWAARRAIDNYGLDASRVSSVGIFGEVELPERDAYAGSEAFAFVSTDFAAKGGPVVLEAFEALRARRPQATLIIVGDRPAVGGDRPGVTCVGFLRKETPEEYLRFRQILASVRALVHPTRSDITPLLVVEAGYFGCPVVSSRRFAIPELVEHGVSGLLLDDPSDVQAVSTAMEAMLAEGPAYGRMRKAAWARARKGFTKADFNARLVGRVREALSPSAETLA